MKLLILTTLIAIVFCKNLPNPNKYDRISKMVTRHGYPIETYTVNTEDGYILQLFRIPHGVQKNQHDVPRKAVLLMHGFLSSAEDFVVGGPSQGLAFYLADQGFDVYLGNARGSPYGQGHTSLDPKKDAAFWKFSFHEIGVADMPAIIDQVISISQQNKIYYVGHMEGATVFYILASQKKYYNDKIERFASLGPIAYLKKSTHPILEKVVENYKSDSWVMKNVGISTFNPSSEVITDAQSQCNNVQDKDEICQNVYFLFNGYNSKNYNQTTIKEVLPRLPYQGSVRQVLHLAHMKESGRFESYSYQNNRKASSYEYDLSQVEVPVALFYSPNDAFSHVDDIQTLIQKLPNVYMKKSKDNFTNNLDMVYADNLEEFNTQVTAALLRQPQQQQKPKLMLY